MHSSQETCSLLNRFEKEVEEVSQDADLDDVIVEEMDVTERNETPQSTAAQTDRYGRKFTEFLRTHSLQGDLRTMSENKLNLYLRYFYHELRAENGSLLSPSTLATVRAGINRYLGLPPINRSIDILQGDAFAAANRMLTSVARMYLKAGGKTNHIKAIERGDLSKIFEYFDRSSAVLQEEIYNYLLFWPARSGRFTSAYTELIRLPM